MSLFSNTAFFTPLSTGSVDCERHADLNLLRPPLLSHAKTCLIYSWVYLSHSDTRQLPFRLYVTSVQCAFIINTFQRSVFPYIPTPAFRVIFLISVPPYWVLFLHFWLFFLFFSPIIRLSFWPPLFLMACVFVRIRVTSVITAFTAMWTCFL